MVERPGQDSVVADVAAGVDRRAVCFLRYSWQASGLSKRSTCSVRRWVCVMLIPLPRSLLVAAATPQRCRRSPGANSIGTAGSRQHPAEESVGRPTDHADSPRPTHPDEFVGGALVVRCEHHPDRGDDSVEFVVGERQLFASASRQSSDTPCFAARCRTAAATRASVHWRRQPRRSWRPEWKCCPSRQPHPAPRSPAQSPRHRSAPDPTAPSLLRPSGHNHRAPTPPAGRRPGWSRP